MRVVQINAVYGAGSTGSTAIELAEGLRARGHFAYAFYASGTASYPNSARIGNVLDHKAHALLSRLTGLQGYFSHLATRRMLKQLEALKPDVVHLRNLHANYINLGMLLRWLAKNDIAVALTLHDCWWMTGKCIHYTPARCEKWKTRCGPCPLIRLDTENPTWFFDRTRKCFSDKKQWFDAIPRLEVACVSQWIAGEAKQSMFRNREPIAIYNWIDRAVFFPRNADALREQHQWGGSFVVLMVTNQLAERKGYRELLGLAERLPEDCKLVVAGRNDLGLSLPARVTHIPHIADGNALAALYSAADVCVNTTRFEAFGKVTAEALCCGTPVIVYNNTASPELVGPGCGSVVDEAEGVDGVAKAVERVRQNGKAFYSRDCLAFTKDRFSLEQGVEAYIRLYRSLMEKR